MALESAPAGRSPFDEERIRRLLEGVLSAVPLRLALLDLELRFVWVGPGLGCALGFETEGCLGRSIREVAPALAGRLEPLMAELLANAPAGRASDFALGSCGDESNRAGRGELRLVTGVDDGVIGVAIVVPPAGSASEDAMAIAPRRELGWCGFVARFAHDLRNPLTTILASAQMLRRYGTEKPEIVDWAAVGIERQARQMSARLSEALALVHAKLGTLVVAMATLDLGPILERVVAEFRTSAHDAGLTLVAEFPSHGLPVRGEAVRLEQILTVLLTRAVETTPGGGSVQVGAVRNANHIVVRVRDTGTGFASGPSEAVFDPFDCTDGTVGPICDHKHRVGLALARALAALLRGSLTAASAGVGRGAEFVLSLPIGDMKLDGDRRPEAPPGDLLP